MELINQILAKNLLNEEITAELIMPDISHKIDKIMYHMLVKIKEALEDDTLEDFECIEEIVRIYEKYGNGVSYRHDY